MARTTSEASTYLTLSDLMRSSPLTCENDEFRAQVLLLAEKDNFFSGKVHTRFANSNSGCQHSLIIAQIIPL